MGDPRASGRTDYSANTGAEKGSTYSRVKCPDCGRKVGNFPNHLPCEESQ